MLFCNLWCSLFKPQQTITKLYIHRIPTLHVSPWVVFYFLRSSQIKKPQAIFLTPGICLFILFSLFFWQVLSTATNTLLSTTDSCLIFSDLLEPFNLFDTYSSICLPDVGGTSPSLPLFRKPLSCPVSELFSSPHPRKLGTPKGQSLTF